MVQRETRNVQDNSRPTQCLTHAPPGYSTVREPHLGRLIKLAPMTAIVLATLNARYIHASLGLRYLAANMSGLAADTTIAEFTIAERPIEIVERLLRLEPRVVGFGVYLWNVEETTRVVAMLKRVRPETVIVIGGPEVSFEIDAQPITQLADHVITGPGDVAFPRLAARLLAGERPPRVIAGEEPALESLMLPYDAYTERDLRERMIYVEASRGCPFKCEFCLSSLDRTATPFPLAPFLDELARLHARGARHFKFVDRTFNLNTRTSLAILQFFLERMPPAGPPDLFAHFELIPDHLPEKLKDAIRRFPAGSLQFEIGIQTFNPEVQSLISRRQDNARAEANLRWLRAETTAHLHVDLIAGLPGDDLGSFGRGFDRLVALGPHEIQVGVLKRLRGSPIIRHTGRYHMVYNPYPPYDILSTDRISFDEMRRINRFARYWDLIANSGRFRTTLSLLLADRPFDRFMTFSDELFARTGKTNEFALERLYEAVHALLVERLGCAEADVRKALEHDYHASGARGAPAFLRRTPASGPRAGADPQAGLASRQARHRSTS